MMRLQLSRKGNYAVLAVLRLARTGEATTAEIAAAEGIPASSLTHVLAALVRSGVVVSSQGRGGGYRLPWTPETITLRQIVEAVDGPLGEPRCFLDQLPCRTQVLCDVHDRWARLQGQISKTLAATTIAALLECPRRPTSTHLPPAPA